MFTSVVAIAALVAAPAAVSAWSSNEHQMIGTIAQHFLAAETVAQLNVLLPDFAGNLSAATIWADNVKGSPAYKWSASSHFIDADDVTPADAANVSCNVDMARDCPDGYCVVGAIYNYTERADVHNNFSAADRAEAAHFLAHYIGDISQPLHNCKKLLGGNGWYVSWNGSAMEPPPYQKYKHNMHFIWDQFMVEADIQLNYNNSFDAYVLAIVNDLKTGIWKHEHHLWNTCTTPYVTASGRVIHSACPLEWSNDANDYNCDSVWENAGNGTAASADLFFNGYYEKNKDVARKQIAKAGLRLASVLNSVLPNNGKLTHVN
ncbi:hypothetical protein HK101_001011 [Irineochytrium annulatum]|nr:hypothetical protein HK101_001011 [Irineochytrium annulatum]